MRKLAAVQDARAVMTEGMDWSAWRWLLERQRVREIADRATAALDAADKKTKSSWSEDLKQAYAQLLNHSKRNGQSKHVDPAAIDPATILIAKAVKEADDKAERARLDAENTFDEAERQFSADMAREGARKALATYDLREAAIRKAEGAVRPR